MKLLLFLQPMSSLPLWGGSGWRQQTTARQVWNFVGLPCKLWFGRKSIIALGRKDIIAITLADSNNNLEKTQKSANELLNTITFNPGNRYEDYNPKTDKTAEYGLTALIVGAAAAKKFGLIAVIIAFIAKFSKIIIVAVAGGLYAMKKIFSRRRHDDDDDD